VLNKKPSFSKKRIFPSGGVKCGENDANILFGFVSSLVRRKNKWKRKLKAEKLDFEAVTELGRRCEVILLEVYDFVYCFVFVSGFF
jgi:hypothetical protein